MATYKWGVSMPGFRRTIESSSNRIDRDIDIDASFDTFIAKLRVELEDRSPGLYEVRPITDERDNLEGDGGALQIAQAAYTQVWDTRRQWFTKRPQPLPRGL